MHDLNGDSVFTTGMIAAVAGSNLIVVEGSCLQHGKHCCQQPNAPCQQHGQQLGGLKDPHFHDNPAVDATN
jgi:hypothetical protein